MSTESLASEVRTARRRTRRRLLAAVRLIGLAAASGATEAITTWLLHR
ncbi:hypothetical protein ACGF1Z_01045 [Streptomyces sp. NPDC048018]